MVGSIMLIHCVKRRKIWCFVRHLGEHKLANVMDMTVFSDGKLEAYNSKQSEWSEGLFPWAFISSIGSPIERYDSA